MKNTDVAIIMGSDSDLEVMKEAARVLKKFLVSCETTVISAHRTPQRMYDFAKSAKKKNVKVIIAGAGGAAHLPGMTASLTNIPVIGVPIKTKTLNGLDSLLSIAQMPTGIPVATVAINGAKNAAILAVQILAISSPILYKKLENYKETMKKVILKKAKNLELIGPSKYLSRTKKP